MEDEKKEVGDQMLSVEVTDKIKGLFSIIAREAMKANLSAAKLMLSFQKGSPANAKQQMRDAITVQSSFANCTQAANGILITIMNEALGLGGVVSVDKERLDKNPQEPNKPGETLNAGMFNMKPTKE